MSERKKARIIKADKSLQKRIGTGPLDGKLVRKCQEVMDATKVDFGPLAREYLKSLEDALNKCWSKELDMALAADALGNPVMQLKAHAAMFRYPLVGRLATIMLGFLETVEQIDSDVLDIVNAHRQTLKTIINNRLEGDGGVRGEKLQEELKDACKRYFAKKQQLSAQD